MTKEKRIVTTISLSLKRALRARLAEEGLTLKAWFEARVRDYIYRSRAGQEGCSGGCTWSSPFYLVREEPRSCFGPTHSVVGFKIYCSVCGNTMECYTEAHRPGDVLEEVASQNLEEIRRIGRREELEP
jgi:hypothetical protein